MRIITLTTDYMWSHCYLMIENGHAVVIDPGDAELVCRAVSEEGVAVDFGILTHEHCDHVFGCSETRETLNCRMLSSRICNENLKDSKKNFSRYFNSFIGLQTKCPSEAQKEIQSFTTCADEVFESEHSFTWMNHTLYLRETPGHSSGSICILVDQNTLFSGDTLLKDDETGTQFLGGSKELLETVTIPWLKSIPGDIQVYPGHGESFILGDRLAQLIE